jgi:hypothetical protein
MRRVVSSFIVHSNLHVKLFTMKVRKRAFLTLFLLPTLRVMYQSARGLSVEGGRAARLSLDLTLTPVPIPSLYEAEYFYEAKHDRGIIFSS